MADEKDAQFAYDCAKMSDGELRQMLVMHDEFDAG